MNKLIILVSLSAIAIGIIMYVLMKPKKQDLSAVASGAVLKGGASSGSTLSGTTGKTQFQLQQEALNVTRGKENTALGLSNAGKGRC